MGLIEMIEVKCLQLLIMFESYVSLLLLLLSRFSHVRLCATP